MIKILIPSKEACEKLNLDTRIICKAVYEKSTQAFISKLNPQLRFYRSYTEIRPFLTHCKEKIIKIDFEKYMKIALHEAKISKSEGNKGYGAVIVYDQNILSQAHDTAITENDPSKHAEFNAIREAVKYVKDANLTGTILFSTCEPCPMCTSLAIWSNLTTIIFGASIEDSIQLGRTRININAKEIIDKSPTMIEVIDGVMKDKCLKLYNY